jgi:hypothetical protein
MLRLDLKEKFRFKKSLFPQELNDEADHTTAKIKTEAIHLSLLPKRTQILLDLRLWLPNLFGLHAGKPVGDKRELCDLDLP